MKKPLVFTLILITLMTLGVVCIQPIKAQYQGNVTINVDRSISPSTAPVQQTSSVYSLISDIAGSITVNTSNIILEGNGHSVSGISLQGTTNVTVKNFVVTMRNEFSETVGMSLDNASNNLIVNNTVTGFWSIQALNGILFAGIHVVGGNSNTFSQNNVMYNLDGMEFVNTSSNLIVQNNVTSNPIWSPYTTGIYFGGASNNTIYYNNIANCTYQAKAPNSINAWDDGHLGNYWSDYQTKYPNASMIENSGVGNTPYYVDAQNKDNYPLMKPVQSIPQVESSPTPTNSTASAVENSWVEKAPIPTARGYLRVAVVNEKIYAIGGNIFGTNEEYNPATDTWTTKASMPDPQTLFAIAVYQGKIYCIGGMPAGSSGGSGANQVYDPETDSWENKASMPTGRYGLQAQVVDDRIYLIGGRKLLGYNQGFEELNMTEVYDPVSDTWSTGSSMPNSAGYVSAVVDDKIFVIGSMTQIYDPKIDTWSIGTAPTEKLVMGVNGDSAAAAATTGEMAPKRIYVYDGSYLQVYDPLNNSWTFGANPPINRQHLSIAVVNDTLYFIGGFTDHFNNIPGYFKDYNTNEQYIPFGYGTIEQQTFPTATVATISVVTALVIVACLIVYFKNRHH